MSSWSRDYPFDASDGSSLSVAGGDGRGGVVPSTNHFSSNKVDCWIGGGDFVSSNSRLSPISFHLRCKS